MRIELDEVVQLLKEQDNIWIFTHKNPDGDTLGSGFGLYYGLKQLGKKVCLKNSDVLPSKFSYFYEQDEMDQFDPDYIVSVDIADAKLLGDHLSEYEDRIDLCIDHHVSNVMFAKKTYLDGDASSVSEMMFSILVKLGVTFHQKMADSIYSGIVTDTGCFKFSNTSAHTHRVTADLIEMGADYEQINRQMFETKSFARIALERMVLDGMAFYFDNQCAMIVVTRAMMAQAGADYSTFDGVSAITRQIEGVEIGFTIREIGDDEYKISVRTSAKVDASKVCNTFGGGGHVRAAGCTMLGKLHDVKAQLLAQAKEKLV